MHRARSRLSDPLGGLGEMARVTRSGGVVVASVWDHGGGRGPLGVFWSVARELDSTVADESHFAGAREGHLVELFKAADLRSVDSTMLSADLEMPSFHAWWEPFTLGVRPAGAYVSSLDPLRRDALRDRCHARHRSEPFTIEARAWAARGLA